MKYIAIIDEEMLSNFRIDEPPCYMSEDMIFHTGFRAPNTFNELKEHTDTFDDFLKIMTEEMKNE